MKKLISTTVILLFLFLLISTGCNQTQKTDTVKEPSKMDWWSEARYGMFIHWGLYSVLAGEWDGEIRYAEWIRSSAKIPVEVYDTLVRHFNPVEFNASEWVRMAKDAGMKYIVITSKHHDGFCLFDSEYTDFDIMSTPFKRDILAELSQACREQGIVLCFYHSIMDWHHPDYLPRRNWETDRSVNGADFDRYVAYMKNQLKELTTKYGAIGVLWFDGEWESTWTHERGVDLYNYVTSLQPGIIVNNRVDTGRGGMAGMTMSSEYVGDYGTPEQEVPATGFPGTCWESCITLNNNWGYVKNDDNWKSPKTVIRMLTDIASKGGNLLLNIGPKPDGSFPEESIKILEETGSWMKKNGSSIYGTGASPFANIKWGRCTSKEEGNNTVLYLHVFEWPADGDLVLSGITNKIKGAYLLDGGKKLRVIKKGPDIHIALPTVCPDELSTVVVLKIAGKPQVFEAPVIANSQVLFIDTASVNLVSFPDALEVHYTLDGTDPSAVSPVFSKQVKIAATSEFSAAFFMGGERVGAITKMRFTKVDPLPAIEPGSTSPGLRFAYFKGKYDSIPEMSGMKPLMKGVTDRVSVVKDSDAEYFAQSLSGYVLLPEDGVYKFTLVSDDGSKLYIDGRLITDNDGMHSSVAKSNDVALAKGYHNIVLEYVQGSGSKELNLFIKGPRGDLDINTLIFH